MYSGFLHDITEILLKVALNTINLSIEISYIMQKLETGSIYTRNKNQYVKDAHTSYVHISMFIMEICKVIKYYNSD